MRTLVVAALTGTLLTGLGTAACTKDKPEPNPSTATGVTTVELKLSPSKDRFGPREPVVLTTALTNRSTVACRASRAAHPAVTILSLTRDGAPVPPVFSEASYISGFSDFLAGQLVPLAPGATVTATLRSTESAATGDRAVLRTSALGPNDAAALTLWPVDQPGAYVLTARYLLAPFEGAPADACPASGDPVSVSFTVTGG